jgi:peptidoglycan/LPS O-acetylase OafA/YrhL
MGEESTSRHLLNPLPGAGEAGAEIQPGVEDPTPKRPPRFPSFDGLRAIAAITVVAVHTSFVSGFTPRHRRGLGAYTSRLEIGVSVFFLISGFLLYRPFTVTNIARSQAPNPWTFWVRRLLRIIPAYWLALFVLTSVLHGGTDIGPGGWKAYVTHYLLLQIYFPSQYVHGIPAAWTLAVEMTFYLFIPLYAFGIRWLIRTWRPRNVLAVEFAGIVAMVVVSFAWRLAMLHLIGQSHREARVAITWLPGNLDLFAMGMVLAVLSAWWHHHDREPGLFSHRAFPYVSWALAFYCFWQVCNLKLPVLPLYQLKDIDLLRQTLYGLFAFFLLLPAVFGPQHRGLIRKFLQLWPVASLGVVSYGIYLWHETFIYEWLKWGHWRLFSVNFALFFSLVLGTAIAAATISYFALEKPVLRLKRRFGWFERARPRST